MMKKQFLCEVSWEVCNKVGGINTVLRTKVKRAQKNFEDRYVLIGPAISQAQEFVETQSDFFTRLNVRLQERKLHCRMGYWDIPGRPMAILVSYLDRYNTNDLLLQLWNNFKVDSYGGEFEYVEPVLFSTAAAEVIELIAEEVKKEDWCVIGHFHEWLSGAGLLYLRKKVPHISTAFTTHATILGRALAENRVNIYDLPEGFNADQEAARFHIMPKYTLERAAAKEANSFSAVSNVVADECYAMLGAYPRVLYNGLDTENVEEQNAKVNKAAVRKTILSVAEKLTGKSFPANTQIWMTSGRLEVHNKGYDIFLKSLASLKRRLQENSPPILALFLIAIKNTSAADSLLAEKPETHHRLLTHRLDNIAQDPIITLCEQLDLNHDAKDPVNVLYCPAYLSGQDGVFNLTYDDILASVDLTVFPSYYEPWGYTPLESLAYGVPTVTSNLAGFGAWASNLMNIQDCEDSIAILEYKNRAESEVVDSLSHHLEHFLVPPESPEVTLEKTLAIARLADWEYMYANYLTAYQEAIEVSEQIGVGEGAIMAEARAAVPRFHEFERVFHFPTVFSDLQTFAYNLWWVWNDADTLFKDLNPEIWKASGHNPIHFLNHLSTDQLQQKAKDKAYLKKYKAIIQSFKKYCASKKVPREWTEDNLITPKNPIAFFCLEYGMASCLPIYSGGLGILAGDYLKTMSDLNVPLVAFGLFYKEGYFTQILNEMGEQVEIFKPHAVSDLPMTLVKDEQGNPVMLGINLLDRTVYAQVWLVRVGRIALYLFDTDIENNQKADRQITNRLYVGSQEARLLQEFVLGIGGAQFIETHLQITPSLYHLNEGHSAFLMFALMQKFYQAGYTYEESLEAVRTKTIFTTHTPVPAGNEIYPHTLLEKYFVTFAKAMNVSTSILLKLGQGLETGSPAFSMTAFALRLSVAANAVSKLHGEVVHQMWSGIWPGFLPAETPIDYVTNGIHVTTWLGLPMQRLYHKYLGSDFAQNQNKARHWSFIRSIPDEALWETHQTQKTKLFKVLREKIIKEYADRGESQALMNATLEALKEDTLCIGISRRFATYKRHTLIVRYQPRLAQLLTNAEKPAILLVAGKAHPSDPAGKALIHEIMRAAREPIFKGHIIFLENYDISLARRLVQGVDVWLNTPVLYTEACGTSGMKVVVNGGMHFSVKDGWWYEGYTPEVGWEIESVPEETNTTKRDDMENLFLLSTLEESIVPAYYSKGKGKLSPVWLKKMKHSLEALSQQFNTERMAADYLRKLYHPVSLYSQYLMEDQAKKLKEMVVWKTQIKDRFKTVLIKNVLIEGIEKGKISAEGILRVNVLLFSGKCKTEELRVELVLTRKSEGHIYYAPKIVPLVLQDIREEGMVRYSGEYDVSHIIFDAYSIRVYPCHNLLYRPQEAGVVYWQ